MIPWVKRLGLVALGLLLGLVALELSFRIAGMWAPFARLDQPPTGEHVVILAVGDSHTWGKGQGYPARMAERLAERSSQYRVINLGVPGSNTAQHRRRFRQYLELYQPRLIVAWMGINNNYNRTDSEHWTQADVAEAGLTRNLLDDVRLIRFLRLLRNQRALNAVLSEHEEYVVPEATGKIGHHTRALLSDEEDVFVPTRTGDALAPDETARVTALDLGWMVETARKDGVPMILITYGLPGGWFGAANEGIRRVAAQTEAPLIESEEAIRRLKEEFSSAGIKFNRSTFYDRSVHPTQRVYQKVGDMVLEEIDEGHLLPRPNEANPR